MITGDLETDTASSVLKRPTANLFQSVLRSLTGQQSRAGNRSRSNTTPGDYSHYGALQSTAYAACMSSLSLFIHDSLICVDEADDPYNAICFFYPPNYTPTEQWEFTGPIVGAVRFMSTFANSPPKAIHLATSSIALMCFDNYTVALKASKVLCSNALEACLHDLHSVFSLFLKDLECVRKLSQDKDPELALSRFKHNLAHIWTMLLNLVEPCKLLHPIAHIPHFVAATEIESQLFQFFACIVAVLSGFSRNTFGCLLSFNSQLVHSTFDVSLTRTLMLSNNLIRTMPQTARVLSNTHRLPKSAFVRYAYASRAQLLESRMKICNHLKNLPPAAQIFLGRFAPSIVESAFAPRYQNQLVIGASGSDSPNSAIMSRYFDYAWAMAGPNSNIGPHVMNFDASFAGFVQDFGPPENAEHWESRSSSMSSVAVDLNRLYGSHSPTTGRQSRDEITDDHSSPANWSSLNLEQAWSTSNNARNIGRMSRPVHQNPAAVSPGGGNFRSEMYTSKFNTTLLNETEQNSDDEDSAKVPRSYFESKEDQAFAFGRSQTNNSSAGGTRQTRGAENNPELDSSMRVSSSVPFANTTYGLVDSGHSSLMMPDASSVSGDNGQDARAGPSCSPASPNAEREVNDFTVEADDGNRDGSDTVKTVLYVQSHGPLSLISLLPNSPNLIKGDNIRRLYDILLPVLADVCSLLIHLDSESVKTISNEAVVVSFEPSRQRLHRLGLCRACNSDIRFDTQLFGIHRLFSKDPSIKDLSLSDWNSYVRVTREMQPPDEASSVLNDSMPPYRPSGSDKENHGHHSYIKVKRNGCASSMLILPSPE